MDLEEIRTALAEIFLRVGLSPDLTLLRRRSTVADGASIFLVGRKPKQGVLLISPREFPFVVSDEQVRAAAMRNHLGPELGSTILSPLAEGNLVGQSYAILPFERSLSTNRLWWAVQRRLIKRDLIGWLQAVISKRCVTLEAETATAYFAKPLRHLRSVQGIDPAIQAVATAAMERLQAGVFRPRVAPMHNDFWKGNILLPRNHEMKSRGPCPFFIIDWRGSRIDGFPFFDLLRFSMSFALTPDELQREIVIMSEQLGCELSDVKSYLAAALGEIAMRLDQFPLEHFLNMATACFSELQKVKLINKSS